MQRYLWRDKTKTRKVSIDEGKGAYGDKTRKVHKARINDGEGAKTPSRAGVYISF